MTIFRYRIARLPLRSRAMASPIPQAKTDDSEDVSWALQTAESQWARGDREEALKWLRRAVESASEGEDDQRALDLAKAAADLAAQPAASVPPSPVSRPPPLPPRSGPSVTPPRPSGVTQAPRSSSGSVAPPRRASGRPTAPKAAASEAPRPVAARTVPGPTDPKPQDKESLRKTARKSHAGEVQRGRGPADESTHTHEMVFTATQQVDAAQSASSTLTEAQDAHRDPMATKPPDMPGDHGGADAWPTEAIKGADLPSFEHERTRIGAAAYHSTDTDEHSAAGPRPSQALRVVLYRVADGSLRIARAGTDVSAVTVDVMLVAMDHDVDLRAWLSSK